MEDGCRLVLGIGIGVESVRGLGEFGFAGAEGFVQSGVKDFADERRLAGTADASEADEAAERDGNGEVLEVVAGGVPHEQVRK